MTNGKKARTARRANPKPVKNKVVTPWFMRNSLVLRKGQGSELHETPGTPVSAKKLERISKIYNPKETEEEIVLA